MSDGFSGAEIERVLVYALYNSELKQLKDEDILQAIKATKPLSIIMDKQISALREWALSRTVSAN